MAKRGGSEPLKQEEKRPLNSSNIKKLLGVFRFIMPYKGLFIFGLISLALSTFTILAFPKLAGELLDVATGKSKYFTTINQVIIALVVVLFVQSIFSFIRVYTFATVSERGMADVRKAVYQKVIWLPMTFFDNRRVGELMSRITSDVGTLQETFSFTLAEFLRQTLSLIFGIAIITYLAPTLTLFMLLTFPVLVISALVFGKYIRKLSRKTQDKLAEANVIVEESLQSVLVVKAFTNEVFEINRYTKALRDVVSTALQSAKYRSLFISFVIFVIFGGIVAVGGYGANLVQSGSIKVGELFSFVIYTSLIGFSIGGLGDIYTQLQRAIGSSERVLEILNEKDEAEFAYGVQKLTGAIEFDHVSFSYPSRTDYQVLKDLNFKIDSGEKIALVGPSGSGKSTIINLLMRLYPISEGNVKVDDTIISDYNLTAYRQNLGVVPQEVILFGGTIFDNIAYGKP
ncbi:MAG TPA: ABC transporter transmembrane domain-containing protein, partial [Cyclobacteriaceae bacterium]